MKVQLRTPTRGDWPAILHAANASLPWRVEPNEQWLNNRMTFDEQVQQRRHYVAEDADSGEVVGYGSVEGSGIPGRFRVFIVMDSALLPSAGEIMLQRLRADLLSLGATGAWVREEARDSPLLEFFRSHGFGRKHPFTTEQGLEVVTLELALGSV